ncbi:hypothetical protein ABFV05_000812 [Capra hircus]
MCPLAFSAGGGDPDGPGPGGGVGEPACGGKGGGREEEEEDEEEEEEDEEEEEEEDEEEERHHSPVPVCACGPGNRRRPGLAPKRGSVTRSGACVLCRGPADRTGRGKDGASRTEHGSPVVETGVCPTGRGFGSRCDVRKPWPLKRAHAGAAAVQREISSGSSCPSKPGRAGRAAGGPGGWSTRQGPRHLPGPAAECRGVRSGRPAGRAAGRPGRAPATAPARRQRAGACGPGGRPAGRPGGWSTRQGPRHRAGPAAEPGRPAGRPAPPGKKGRAQGPRRRPRAVLPLPAGRDGTEGRDTRADARVGGDWLAPPAPRPRASPPGEGTAGPPCDGPGLPSAPRLSPRPPAQPAGEDPRRGSGGRGAAPRGREAPPGAAPLLSSPPTSAPARSAEDGGPPHPTGARGPGPGAEDTPPPARGEAEPPRREERERESERPRPGRSDKPLCRGLTFNRSQRGSCSATYETPTQKQVVYEWFSTRCPTNVRCVTGEGAAAFPAAPRVPGRRALRTGPRSRRAAGARRAAAPAGGGTRATARRRGRRGTGYPRPTEAPAALPYRSAWAGF